MRKLFFTLALISVLGFAAPKVNADALIIGGGGSFNRFPFGTEIGSTNYQAGATYQQLYNRSSFAGPIAITQIAFASSSFSGAPGVAGFNFNVRLGTAATSAIAPSSTFSANRGADFTTVFSGQLTATLSRSNTFDLLIPLATPFAYNPGDGDLLFDVVFNSQTIFTGNSLNFVGDSSSVSRRVFNASPSLTGRADFNVLQTRFIFTPVPEPMTIILLGTGLIGVGAAVRKRRSESNK